MAAKARVDGERGNHQVLATTRAVAFAFLVVMMFATLPSPLYGARNLGTAVNVGALGIGPLLAGLLVVAQPLTVPYVVMVVLGTVALSCVARAPETGTPAPRAAAQSRAAGRARRARLPVPAAAGTIAAFAGSGLFAGDVGASTQNTVLGFEILVALGVSFSGRALLARRTTGAEQAAQPATNASKERAQ